LTEIGPPNALELDLEHPRFRPLALVSEPHLTDESLEGRPSNEFGESIVIEAARGKDCLLQNLKLGIALRRKVIS
jgi:hypothetical protein